MNVWALLLDLLGWVLVVCLVFFVAACVWAVIGTIQKSNRQKREVKPNLTRKEVEEAAEHYGSRVFGGLEQVGFDHGVKFVLDIQEKGHE